MKKATLVISVLTILFVPRSFAQPVCNTSGNLVIYSNYDGGIVTINVDANIPDLRIGICTYEPVQVTITGPFVSNVTEVVYAGFNSMQNNNNCNQGNFVTSITGVSSAIASIKTYPPIGYSNPNGHPNMVGTGGQCDTSLVGGGGNTIDEIVYYFQQETGGTLRAHFAQYGCWLNTSYNVSAGGNCCILPNVAVAPVASFTTSNATICTGTCIDFQNTSAGSPFTGYGWSFPGADVAVSADENPSNIYYNTPGNYAVRLTVITASDSNTTTIDGFISVVEGEGPEIDFSYPEVICLTDGASVLPTLSPENTTGGTYSSSAGIAITPSTGAIDLTASQPGVYEITYSVTDTDCGPLQTLTGIDTVELQPAISVSISPAGPLTVCQGETVTLTAEPGFTDYVWSDQSVGESIVVSATGSYSVSVDDDSGCQTDPDTVAVTVVSPPVAGFSFTQQQGYVVDFTNTSAGATSFLWDFGSGFTSTETDPSYDFLFDNTWPVRLIVSNECGADTLNVPVEVIKSSGIDEQNHSLFQLITVADGLLIKAPTASYGRASIKLMSVSGQLVYSETGALTGEQSLLVPTAGFPSGIYIICIETEFGVTYRKCLLED